MDLQREKRFALTQRYARQQVLPQIVEHGDPNEVILMTPGFLPWAIDTEYAINDTRLWNGQPVSCIQAHSTKDNPHWTPDAAPSLWRMWHATTPEYAQPYAWRHALDNYKAGEYMRWGNEDHPEQVYMCLAESTHYTPDVRPQDWEEWPGEGAAVVVDTDPVEEVVEPEPAEETTPKWADLPDGHLFAVGAHFMDNDKTYLVLREFQKQGDRRPPALIGNFYEVVTV